MKTKTIHIMTMALLPAALFTLTSCSSTSTPPPPVGSAVRIYTKGVPRGVVVQTVKVTATVTAIDQAKRKATLLASDGAQITAVLCLVLDYDLGTDWISDVGRIAIFIAMILAVISGMRYIIDYGKRAG